MDRLYFQWHITDACNFRCRHCYQDSFGISLELDFEKLKFVSDKIIQEAKRRNNKAVINITGGEPFLKKELFELLAYLDSQKEIAQLIIITNGSLINRQVIKKLNAIKKLNQIKISLDGAGSLSNDVIRQPGSFDKAIETIGLLKQESSLSIIIMFTAMKSNFKEIVDMLKLCQKFGIDGLIIERFFPLGQGLKIKERLLDSSDWLALGKTLLNLTQGHYLEEDIVSYRAFWIELLNERIELLGANCNIGQDSFCIMPDASVFPCRRFALSLGNLLETSLEEIASCALLMDIINGKRKGKCSYCDVLECRGCAALSYLIRGDYLAQDYQCWYESVLKK